MCIDLVLYFCVFKQKTAYEMRISDWSSDVCSSDLPSLTAQMRALGQVGIGSVADLSAALQVARASAGTADEAANNIATLLQKIKERKSVVEGQSVSVSVDVGGSRLIKQKTKCQVISQNYGR